MAVSKAQIEAQARYDAVHCKNISMKLNLEYDADVLEWWANQENKQGRLKELIREDIERQKKSAK